MLLYGKNSIAERLKANPKTIRKIFLLKDFDDSAILHLIKKAGITVKELKKSQPAGIRDDVNNQGVIAEVDEGTTGDPETDYDRCGQFFVVHLVDDQRVVLCWPLHQPLYLKRCSDGITEASRDGIRISIHDRRTA